MKKSIILSVASLTIFTASNAMQWDPSGNPFETDLINACSQENEVFAVVNLAEAMISHSSRASVDATRQAFILATQAKHQRVINNLFAHNTKLTISPKTLLFDANKCRYSYLATATIKSISDAQEARELSLFAITMAAHSNEEYLKELLSAPEIFCHLTITDLPKKGTDYPNINDTDILLTFTDALAKHAIAMADQGELDAANVLLDDQVLAANLNLNTLQALGQSIIGNNQISDANKNDLGQKLKATARTNGYCTIL